MPFATNTDFEPLPKQTLEIAVVEYVYFQIYVASVIQEHSNRRTASLCLDDFSKTELMVQVQHEGGGGAKVIRSGWWRVRGRRGERAPPPERGTSPATPAAPSPGSCLAQHHLVCEDH